MSQYLTTGEDLTSIANAIRAKTGENSPLVYPNGFVNAINGMEWNWVGANPELIYESEYYNIAFADTLLPTWTPSTTSFTIYDPFNCASGLILDNTKYYNIAFEGYVNFVYNTNPSIAHMEQTYFTGFHNFGARPNTVQSLINNINDWTTYNISAGMHFSIYRTASGGTQLTQNNYGIYFSNSSPSFSNQNKNPFTCNLKTPQVRAAVNNSYMPSDAFSLLDMNNSTIHMKVKLYSNTDNIMHSMMNRIRELYITNND